MSRKPGAHLFAVVNAQASGTDDEGQLATTLARLRNAGAQAEGVATGSPDELEHALETAAGRRVVLVGGDGSLHAVANLTGELPELALLPRGRANNVARALGIPLDRDAAARVAVQGEAHPFDTLEVRAAGRRTVCVEGLSAGFQAAARAGYDGGNSDELRAGVRALIEAVARYSPYAVALDTDGETLYEGSAGQVFISNLPLFGFGFRVNPQAEHADGCFEAIVIPAASRRALVLALALSYRGRHLGRAGTVVRRATSARLRQPMPLAADGRPLRESAADVRLVPGHLSVVRPGAR